MSDSPMLLTMLPSITLTGASEPAAGANVVINMAEIYVRIEDGRFADTHAAVATITDSKGHFELPTLSQDWRLLVLHDGGMVEIDSTIQADVSELTTTSWASIQERVMIGAEPGKLSTMILATAYHAEI